MDPELLLLSIFEILENTDDQDERERAIEHLISQQGQSQGEESEDER